MKVTTVCAGKVDVWDSKEEAMDFFLRGAFECDGSESDRYFSIYSDLSLGYPIGWDGMKYPGIENLLAKRREYILKTMEEDE